MTTPKRKSPAFQFYPDSWLSSADIMMMTPAQEGAYIRLLAIAWLSDDCGLPDDDEALAVLSRLGQEWGNGCSTIVRRKFNARNGRLFNERLLAERKKQEERSKKCAASGVASGRARQNKQLGAERTLNDRSKFVERNGNSSFPSSSPSPTPKKRIKKDTCKQVSVIGDDVPVCPQQEIISLYHEILPMMPKVKIWDTAKEKVLRTRWKEDPERQSLVWWERFFQFVSQSLFLTGRTDTNFVADLEWLIKPSNFSKIANGRYHRGAQQVSGKTAQNLVNLQSWLRKQEVKNGKQA